MKRLRPADLFEMEGHDILFFGQMVQVYNKPIIFYGVERKWPHVCIEEDGQELEMPLVDGDYIGFWTHMDKLHYREFGEPSTNVLGFPIHPMME
jgi:hypothetical protein